MITRSAPLKRTSVKKRRSKPRRGRLRDKKYLEFIATLPCLICWRGVWRRHNVKNLRSIGWQPAVNLADKIDGFSYVQESRTEVAHVGVRGLSQKSSDLETVPLCADHHREQHATAKFWDNHNLDRDAIIRELNRLYEQEKSGVSLVRNPK